MSKRSLNDQLIPRVDGRPALLRPAERLKGEPRRIFTELTASCAPEHFRPTDLPLLEAYAETVALGRLAAATLRDEGVVIAGKPSVWLGVLDRCNRSLVPMAKALRLAPSTRLDPKTAARKTGGFDAEALLQELDDYEVNHADS